MDLAKLAAEADATEALGLLADADMQPPPSLLERGHGDALAALPGLPPERKMLKPSILARVPLASEDVLLLRRTSRATLTLVIILQRLMRQAPTLQVVMKKMMGQLNHLSFYLK